MLKKVLVLAVILVLLGCVGLALAARSSREPRSFGLVDGRLRPCPTTPNCVISDGARGQVPAEALVEPLASGPTAAQAFQAMGALLEAREDMEVVQRSSDYLHATARSGVFGFIDDVELHLDGDAKVLHVRSASRVGKSDLGANAKRVAELRIALEERLSRGDG